MKKRLLIKTLSLLITAILLLEAFPYATETKAYDADSDRIIVSLGDSFSSGEGIPDFYGQKDENGQDYDIAVKVKNEDWLAHRSTKSWPGRLTLDGVDGTMAENRNTHWFFVASSGATTKHLLKKQNKHIFKENGTVIDKKTLPPQLNIFETLRNDGKQADFVTVTIGGNDADFGGIIMDAVLGGGHYLYPGKLKKHLVEVTLKFLMPGLTDVEFVTNGEIYLNLKNAYKSIETAAGQEAKIIVAGYPKLIGPAGGLGFNDEEAKMINDAVSLFNYGIEKLVNQCRTEDGMKIYFASVEESFDTNGAYTINPLLNPIMLPQKEDLIDFTFANHESLENFLNNIVEEAWKKPWSTKGIKEGFKYIGFTSSYSIHPNDKGAQKYAECVQAIIDELDDYVVEDYIQDDYDEPWINAAVYAIHNAPSYFDEIGGNPGMGYRLIDITGDDIPEIFYIWYGGSAGSVISEGLYWTGTKYEKIQIPSGYSIGSISDIAPYCNTITNETEFYSGVIPANDFTNEAPFSFGGPHFPYQLLKIDYINNSFDVSLITERDYDYDNLEESWEIIYNNEKDFMSTHKLATDYKDYYSEAYNAGEFSNPVGTFENSDNYHNVITMDVAKQIVEDYINS